MILLIDNYDSFTYNLVDYFQQIGVAVKVVRNDEPVESITSGDYAGIVLSPGPEKPENAGNLMRAVDHFLGHLPMLGICLGHQAIGLKAGAQLVKAHRPMHGKISNISQDEGILFKSLPQKIDVVRYHSLILQDLPDEFKVTAKTSLGEIMAFDNQSLRAHGLQFHPEAILTEYGLEMLRNWVTFYNIV